MNREFTLDDFMAQMAQIEKLGPINNIMRKIPRMSQLAAVMGDAEVEGQLKRVHAIYNSMNRPERKDPAIVYGMRRRRVARGAGVQANEVSQFIKQYEMSRDMMKAVGNMGRRRG